jgi:hypothetical protein
MSKRLWRYLTVIGAAALAGALVESPAWAHGLVEARRSVGFSVFRGLGLLCCLVVVILVGIGVLIGALIGRGRRRRSPGPGPGDY